MAKDVKKTQKKNTEEKNKKVVKKEEVKKQPNKKEVKKEEIKKEEKVVVPNNVENKEVTEEVLKKVKVKEKKKRDKKVTDTLKKVDDNRKTILFFVVGFLIATLLFRCILWPDRIATLSDGTQPVANINGEVYTADELYEDMKENYSISVLLNKLDSKVLTEPYPDNDEMDAEIKDTAEYYYSTYESYYGYTKEEFLSNYGFASEKAFLESLKLDHRRNKYYEEYAESLVSEKDVEKYYEKEVFGDVDSKHILVKVDKENKDGLADTDAKKLANEIINKLNGGTSWDDVITEYKDKIITEELGYMAFNASLEAPYLEECKNLEVGKYSKAPVLTSYGYHIVFKIAQKDKPKLDDVKDDIIEILASEEKEKDENLYNKSLAKMREDAKLEFVDTVFADLYKKYINNNK